MSDRPLRRGNWSVQELERLRLLLPHRGVAQTAALLRRSPDSVQRKALALLRTPILMPRCPQLLGLLRCCRPLALRCSPAEAAARLKQVIR